MTDGSCVTLQWNLEVNSFKLVLWLSSCTKRLFMRVILQPWFERCIFCIQTHGDPDSQDSWLLITVHTVLEVTALQNHTGSCQLQSTEPQSHQDTNYLPFLNLWEVYTWLLLFCRQGDVWRFCLGKQGTLWQWVRLIQYMVSMHMLPCESFWLIHACVCLKVFCVWSTPQFIPRWAFSSLKPLASCVVKFLHFYKWDILWLQVDWQSGSVVPITHEHQ